MSQHNKRKVLQVVSYNSMLVNLCCKLLIEKRKGPLFTLGNRIELKASIQPGRAPHIIIVTGPPTLPGEDLNPGPLSLDESPLLTELTRPEYIELDKDSGTCRVTYNWTLLG